MRLNTRIMLIKLAVMLLSFTVALALLALVQRFQISLKAILASRLSH
jgi:hypothetical protein